MKLISHRGFWSQHDEKNTIVALSRSFSFGFGTETDVRDCDGVLVISHDPPNANALHLKDLLDIHAACDPNLPLALNIKSDGLQFLLKEAIASSKLENYFFFDMAIPDMLGYLRAGLPFYTRHSDIEPEPILYEPAAGVWLDSFGPDWLTASVIEGHLRSGKSVCIVSPELHGRDHLAFWQQMSGWPIIKEKNVILCTDYPQVAKEFFL